MSTVSKEVYVEDPYHALVDSGSLELLLPEGYTAPDAPVVVITKNLDAEANAVKGVVNDEGSVKGLRDRPDVPVQMLMDFSPEHISMLAEPYQC